MIKTWIRKASQFVSGEIIDPILKSQVGSDPKLFAKFGLSTKTTTELYQNGHLVGTLKEGVFKLTDFISTMDSIAIKIEILAWICAKADILSIDGVWEVFPEEFRSEGKWVKEETYVETHISKLRRKE